MQAGRERPFVSVIIPVYNDGERLERCLELLEQQTYPTEAYEVVAVDNGSDEPVGPHVASFPHARDGYEDRPGPYAARNTGIRMSRGEVIAFTDADCLPDERWLEEGVRALQGDADVGFVGGAVQFAFRDPAHPGAVELYDSLHHLQQKKYVEEDHFGATANVFTWRSVIEQVGDFAASVHVYSDGDQEWGQRVHGAGFDVLYAPEARIDHPARASWRELIKKERRAARGGIEEEASACANPFAYLFLLLKKFLRSTAVPPHPGRVWQEVEDARPGVSGSTKGAFYLIKWGVRATRKGERLRTVLKKYAGEGRLLKQ